MLAVTVHPMTKIEHRGPLTGRNIILGISGGIAAFKCATLARDLIKAGAQVQVIMTPNAREFITPLTMSTLTRRPVITEFFTANTGQWNSHVDLGLWADVMVVAPATASTIAKMANGVADNMLVTTYLSAKCPVLVAPAMDLDMMCHPSTVANIERLASYGNTIITPADGELASGLVGKGRMEEPEAIVKAVIERLKSEPSAENDLPLTDKTLTDTPSADEGEPRTEALDTSVADEVAVRDLCGKHLMITAGPTHEPIDPVRYIANHSSGRMGYALARAAARRGATVTLVSGPVTIDPVTDPNVTTVKVTTARQMLKAATECFPKADIAIMAAAVADFAPEQYTDHKIKRQHDKPQQLVLVPNPDIAAELGQMKRPGQRLIGFALETDDEKRNAIDKLRRKNLDAIVLNSLRQSECFGVDTDIIQIYGAQGNLIFQSPLKTKTALADDILNTILSL